MLRVLNRYSTITISRIEINIIKRALDIMKDTSFMTNEIKDNKALKLLHGKGTEEKGRELYAEPSLEDYTIFLIDFMAFHRSLESSRFTLDLDDNINVKVWKGDELIYTKILSNYLKHGEIDDFPAKNCSDDIRLDGTHKDDLIKLMEDMQQVKDIMKPSRVHKMGWA